MSNEEFHNTNIHGAILPKHIIIWCYDPVEVRWQTKKQTYSWIPPPLRWVKSFDTWWHSRGGGAGPADPETTGPTFWLIASPTLCLQARSLCIVCWDPCTREMNQNPVTMPGLKQKLVVLFWIQNSLRSHLTASNLPGGACPRLPYLRVYANVCT